MPRAPSGNDVQILGTPRGEMLVDFEFLEIAVEGSSGQVDSQVDVRTGVPRS